MKHDFAVSRRISYQSWWYVKLESCLNRARREQRYQAMVRKANSRITKELDLQKFLHRQRIFITSLLGLLRGY